MTNTVHNEMHEQVEGAILRLEGALTAAHTNKARRLEALIKNTLDAIGDVEDELNHTVTVEEAAA